MARAVRSMPQRRVTRSQSRELEDSVQERGPLKNAENGRLPTKSLAPVIEQSPASRVPDAPSNEEGNTNISGTTFLPHDSDSEDGALDPVDMVDEVQDLQQAASRVLDLVGTGSSDPKGIVEAVKLIANPMNTVSKRLKRSLKKLVDIMKVFGNQAFIDVARVKTMIPSVTLGDEDKVWSPIPILQKANCARLALDVILASSGSQTPRQVIETLEKHFPLPFMDKFVKKSQSLQPGFSVAVKPTFELALEIRTQYFITELERCQGEKGFDPAAILKGVFYDELALEDADDSPIDPGSLRGFKLAPTFEDENGCLPDNFQDDVSDLVSELETYLFDDDGAANIQGLKAVFPWQRFCLRTARFVHARDKEVNQQLLAMPSFSDIHDSLVDKIENQIHESDNLVAQKNLQEQFIDSNNETAVSSDHIVSTPEQSRTVFSPAQIHGNQSAPRERSAAVRSSVQSRRVTLPPRVQEGSLAHSSSPAGQNKEKRKKRQSLREEMDEFAEFLRARRDSDRDSHHLSSPAAQAVSELQAATPEANRRGYHVPRETSITAGRTEIAGTPEPEPEPQQLTPRPYKNTQGDSPAVNPIDEALIFGPPSEIEVSASPEGSERINRVSHNAGRYLVSPQRGRYFDSPQASRTRASPRRTIFDRQPNASRVIFSPDAPNAETPRAPPDQLASRKRGRVDSEDEGSDDDAFTQDTAIHNVAERRAQKPPQARPTEKRPRVEDNVSVEITQRTQASDHRRSAPQVSTQVASPPAPAVAHDYAPPPSSSRWADHIGTGAIARGGGGRWTQAEEDRLIFLATRHGTGWAAIKRADDICPESEGGPLLTHRTQVNLKDKARTIVNRCIRNGEAIPVGFHNIKPVSN
ncbi:MYB DNA-binding domain protein [Penicillium macrosclerotiorum]|uniref:MYB DNA-binding domain protein n=1 Tax=Penicillium macrosclerotiorum TaxID=303699 RepID=UPI00254781D8|nr:MYB DNA-binding domain protein [Penicillium macrosclerotiorum]KAJ5692333.1 MYB DNA-binding domain protein [Penicillium macrosclerotiorum]